MIYILHERIDFFFLVIKHLYYDNFVLHILHILLNFASNFNTAFVRLKYKILIIVNIRGFTGDVLLFVFGVVRIIMSYCPGQRKKKVILLFFTTSLENVLH